MESIHATLSGENCAGTIITVLSTQTRSRMRGCPNLSATRRQVVVGLRLIINSNRWPKLKHPEISQRGPDFWCPAKRSKLTNTGPNSGRRELRLPLRRGRLLSCWPRPHPRPVLLLPVHVSVWHLIVMLGQHLHALFMDRDTHAWAGHLALSRFLLRALSLAVSYESQPALRP